MEHNYNALTQFRHFYFSLSLDLQNWSCAPRNEARLIRDTPLNKPVHFLISAHIFRVTRCRHCCFHNRRCRHCWPTWAHNFEMLEFKLYGCVLRVFCGMELCTKNFWHRRCRYCCVTVHTYTIEIV